MKYIKFLNGIVDLDTGTLVSQIPSDIETIPSVPVKFSGVDIQTSTQTRELYTEIFGKQDAPLLLNFARKLIFGTLTNTEVKILENALGTTNSVDTMDALLRVLNHKNLKHNIQL